jgi:hypothetical protein
MKTPKELLEEIVQYADPPWGCAIVITESDSKPNWEARCGLMGLPSLSRYNEKIGQLRGTDPIVDWSDIETFVIGNNASLYWRPAALVRRA